MAYLTEIATYLQTQGEGTIGTDLFASSRIPDTPDAVVVLVDTEGFEPDMGFGAAGVRFQQAGLQVIVRGAPSDYTTPEAKALSVFNTILAIPCPTSLSGTVYNLIMPQQSKPVPFDEDEKLRRLFSSNFVIHKEPS